MYGFEGFTVSLFASNHAEIRLRSSFKLIEVNFDQNKPNKCHLQKDLSDGKPLMCPKMKP